MSNNTYKHFSDEAKYIGFTPTGTKFPSNVLTVQDALALTSPTAPATQTVAGVIRIATNTEALAGVDNTTAITPATLNARLQHPDATTSVKGVLSLATNAEAISGTVSNKSIVPSSLKAKIDDTFTNRTASETANGVLKLATTAAARAGTDDKTAMTPLKTKQAIIAATDVIPIYGGATESTQGVVTLATLGQLTQGTIREGVAVSPYSLNQLTGNETRKGIVRAATNAEANTGTAVDLYISAKGFKNYLASTTNVGTVKLTTTVGTTGSGIALAANANVVSLAGGQTITGTLNVQNTLSQGGSPVVTESSVNNHLPVGTILMWPSSSMPSGGKWAICDGGVEYKASRAALFSVIGYSFGGSGDTFNRPDMRGLFVRGAGTSSHILNERGTDAKGKLKLGEGVNGGSVGQVQKQQVRSHKHALSWGEAYSRNDHPYGATTTRWRIGSNGGRDWDNYNMFTNDGNEVEAEAVRDSHATLNTKDLIGMDNRPWNMSLHYIIKVA